MKVSMPYGSGHGWGIAGSYLADELAKLPLLDGVTLHCITGHDFMPLDQSSWNRINIGYGFFEHDLLAQPFITAAASRWDHIVAGSHWCEEQLRRAGMERTSTILQGIDAARFSFQPPRINDGRFIVFSGGKFEFRKGQDIVIAAMKIFMARHHDVWLSCAWHNQWQTSLKTMEQTGVIDFRWRDMACHELLYESICRNGLDPDRVLLHPPFDNSRMRLIYAESDIGIFPNRCEGGNNMVMSEYMASGRAVIASDHTGHADVITPENAYCLTEYKPVIAYIDGHPTGIWPEASVAELVDLLESAYQNRTALQQKGVIAASDMARLTWSGAAQQFHACASALAARPPQRTAVAQPARSEQHRIADSLFSLGFYAEAEMQYRQLLKSTPFDPALLNSLATALNKQGQLNEALAYYHKALALHPEQHQLRYNLANTLAERGQIDDAIAELQQVVSAVPEFADAWQNLGHYQHQQGDVPNAIRSFRQVITLEPDRSEQWLALARLHEECREFAQALSCVDAALMIRPNDIELLNRKGLLLHELGELDAASASYNAALALCPDNPVVCNNLGNICKSQRMMHKAIEWYDRALGLDPDNATIIFNRSLAFLALGDCTNGWHGFERRFDMIPPVVLPHRDIPPWSGEPLNGRRLLIQAEQVYGDTFMFARFVPLAIEYGGPVVFQCQDRSVQRALDSLGNVCEKIIVRGEPLPDIDLQIPLLSLPRLFDITLDTIPARNGYLTADPARVAIWRQILSVADCRLKVGLVWGGRKAPLNADRSMMLKELEPLLQLPGIQFFSLQVGDDASQLTDYPAIIDLGKCLHDFGETAAAISALDLVITIDSAVAHLSGALGVPVWIMLKYSPDWRWLLERNDSPWYASAQLFRQQAPGDWHSVAITVATYLKKYSVDKK